MPFPSFCIFLLEAGWTSGVSLASGFFRLRSACLEDGTKRRGTLIFANGIITIQQNTKIIGGATHPSAVGPDRFRCRVWRLPPAGRLRLSASNIGSGVYRQPVRLSASSVGSDVYRQPVRLSASSVGSGVYRQPVRLSASNVGSGVYRQPVRLSASSVGSGVYRQPGGFACR